MVPNKVFFTKGVGVHKERLASFELALRAAGVTHRNLVLVSSIYPAVGNKDGLWTTVFAAAIFINEDNLAVEIGKSERDAGSGNEHAPRTYEVSTAH